MILLFLKNNWQILIVAICILALYGVGYHEGGVSVQNKWDEAIAKATVEARITESSNALLSNAIGAKHETNIAAIDANFDSAVASLRSPPNSSMRSSASSSCKPSDGAEAERVRKAIERLKLGKEAELNTEKLLDLQQWVKSFCN